MAWSDNHSFELHEAFVVDVEMDAIVGMMDQNMCIEDREERVRQAREIEELAQDLGYVHALPRLWAEAAAQHELVRQAMGESAEVVVCFHNPTGAALLPEEQLYVSEVIEETIQAERQRRSRALGSMTYHVFLQTLRRIAGVEVREGHGNHKVLRYEGKQTTISPHKGEELGGLLAAKILNRLGIDRESFWNA